MASILKDFLIVCLLLNVGFGASQTPSVGSKCPNKVPIHKIDMRQLTGQWYEVEASPLFAEWMYRCISIKVANFFEKKTEIKIEAIHQNSKVSQPETILRLNASISHTTNGVDGILTVSLVPGSKLTQFEVEHYISPIHILDTDYKNWALLWSCMSYQNANARAELVWILSRQRSLESGHYQSVRNSIIAFDLEGITTLDTMQLNCAKGDESGGSDNELE